MTIKHILFLALLLLALFLGLFLGLPRDASAQPGPAVPEVGDGLLAPVMVDAGAPAARNADDALDPERNPVGVLLRAYKNVRNGNWLAFAALALCVITWVVRKMVAAGRLRFFTSDVGGTLLVLLLAFTGGLSHALVSGGTIDGSLFLTCLWTAVTAISGYAGLWKRLLVPFWALVRGDTTAWQARATPKA